MGASTNIDDWMLANMLNAWVVPAAAQIIPLLVMRGVGNPTRLYLTLFILCEGIS